MKISEAMGLKKSQLELEFVDYDLDGDTRLFLDPYFISTQNNNFCNQANIIIKNFFNCLLFYLREGKHSKAQEMLIHIGEFKDANLGLSQGKPNGKGIGSFYSEQLFKSLKKSKAVKTGLVEDIEDLAIFIEGIGRDRMSDMLGNILKKLLIDYTIEQCNIYGIPLQEAPSGYYWDIETNEWKNTYEKRLIINSKTYVLVPKFIVCYSVVYTPQNFIQHFALNFLQDEYLRLGSSLIKYTYDKNGKVKSAEVTKISIREDFEKHNQALNKDFIFTFALNHADVLKKFKDEVKDKIVEKEELSEADKAIVLRTLIEGFDNIPAGRDYADAYHNWVLGALEVLVYPNLINPKKEDPINDGRKRIDIAFENAAKNGFFFELPTTHQVECNKIMIECKNYSNDIANAELDQMNGRFGSNRGRLGIVCCRSIDDKDLLLKRCVDFSTAQRNYIIVLTDEDIKATLQKFIEGDMDAFNKCLRGKFFELIS